MTEYEGTITKVEGKVSPFTDTPYVVVTLTDRTKWDTLAIFSLDDRYIWRVGQLLQDLELEAPEEAPDAEWMKKNLVGIKVTWTTVPRLYQGKTQHRVSSIRKAK